MFSGSLDNRPPEKVPDFRKSDGKGLFYGFQEGYFKDLVEGGVVQNRQFND
jgi:hypothetical protein